MARNYPSLGTKNCFINSLWRPEIQGRSTQYHKVQILDCYDMLWKSQTVFTLQWVLECIQKIVWELPEHLPSTCQILGSNPKTKLKYCTGKAVTKEYNCSHCTPPSHVAEVPLPPFWAGFEAATVQTWNPTCWLISVSDSESFNFKTKHFSGKVLCVHARTCIKY